MQEMMGWESAYREVGDFEGPPPWNIGEPQPELAAVIRAGKVRSDVLDVGCGCAELSLTLAAEGYTVHGIDLAPTAIAAATRSAADRGLRSVTFQRADVTTIAGFDGRINTVVDSALFWKAHRTTIGHGKPATTMYGRNTVQCNGSHITTGKY